MERNIWKNTGKLILTSFLLFVSSGLFAVQVETELTPSRIAEGESATLKIKITGESSKVKPVKFPAIKGLQISYSGTSRSFQFINGKSWSGTVLSFSIYGEKKGEYVIPPFILETDGKQVASREVSLSVTEPSERGGGASYVGPIRGDVELSSESVFAGEPVVMRYFILSSYDEPLDIEGFYEQPEVKGFVVKRIDEKKNEAGKTYVGSYIVVPIDKGIYKVGGGSVIAGVDLSGGFFSMPGRKKILFPLKKIDVAAIPSEGKPVNFSGDVGEFKIEAEVPSGDFRVYEEIKIPLKVSGKGNIHGISKLNVENGEDVRLIVEDKEQSLYFQGDVLSGEKNFLVTLIPRKEDMVNPGKLFIEYYNPYKKKYEKAESASLSFNILKGDGGGEKGEVQFTEEKSKGGGFSYAAAAAIIALLAAVVIALVIWERKKLNIIRAEIKPEVLSGKDKPDDDRKTVVLNNIRAAVKDNDAEAFLLNSDRGFSLLDTSKLSGTDLEKYGSFKEKIYYCRYGGGKFSEEEMNELSLWLKKHLK